MINRRFDDRASCPAQPRPILNRSRASNAFLCLLLETANMRVDRIKRFDPSKQAATYWNRWKEAGLNRLILSTSTNATDG
jgi:hypothetical protein